MTLVKAFVFKRERTVACFSEETRLDGSCTKQTQGIKIFAVQLWGHSSICSGLVHARGNKRILQNSLELNQPS